MTLSEALELVKSRIHNQSLLRHILADEACMRHLARHFGENEEKWALAGLLHDLDYKETLNNPERHTLLASELLREKGISEDVIHCIQAHAEKVEAKSNMDKALYASDPTTGFIVACALMHPSKKLSGLDVQFLLKRFKEKRFAAGANRDVIKSCEKMNLSLEEFLSICLCAMQEISEKLGL